MSYIQVYVYRIKKDNLKRFIQNEEKAFRVYRKYGKIEAKYFLLKDGSDKYGCTGISKVLEKSKDEVTILSFTFYSSKEECIKVMQQTDSDPEIGDLFKKYTQLVSTPKRTIRAEFEEIASFE